MRRMITRSKQDFLTTSQEVLTQAFFLYNKKFQSKQTSKQASTSGGVYVLIHHKEQISQYFTIGYQTINLFVQQEDLKQVNKLASIKIRGGICVESSKGESKIFFVLQKMFSDKQSLCTTRSSKASKQASKHQNQVGYMCRMIIRSKKNFLTTSLEVLKQAISLYDKMF